MIIKGFWLLLVLFISSGCQNTKWTIPEGFIGVTKIEIIDYLSSNNHQFRFLIFTSVDNPIFDGFKNEYIEKITVHSLPVVYLSNQGKHTPSLMYEINIEVKPKICTFSKVKLAFERGVKEVDFGYYEMIEGKMNSTSIDVSLLYDFKGTDNTYNLQLLIHNYRLNDITLEQIKMIEKGDIETMLIESINDKVILSDNIKLISDLKLVISDDVFYTQGLINLEFSSSFQYFDHTVHYIFDYLPDLYHLQMEGMEVSQLAIIN